MKSLKFSPELNRLIAAAVVDKSFCRLLLSNPKQAVAQGANNETFDLSYREKELLFSIRASSLSELVTLLAAPRES